MPGQVYTHPFFIFTANNESCWEFHTERKSSSEQRGLERIPYAAEGWQLARLSVTVTQAGSFTHNLLFPPAGESLFLDLWFVFHMIYTSGFCSVSFSWTQRDFYTAALQYVMGNRKYQTFPRSFGYPPGSPPTPPPPFTFGNDPKFPVGRLRLRERDVG